MNRRNDYRGMFFNVICNKFGRNGAWPQKKGMTIKSTECGNYMQEGLLKYHKAWTTMNTTTIMKSLEYPLAATTLSKTDIRGILAPALLPGLQGSGFGKSFPPAVLYAPYT